MRAAVLIGTWLTHVQAEEKRFVPHTPGDEEEQVRIVFGTTTDDCVCELKQTGERRVGHDAARAFSRPLLASFSGMHSVPRAVVIGPQGILDVADVTATQTVPFAGIDRVGQPLLLEWFVSAPWDPDRNQFERETFYSIREVPS